MGPNIADTYVMLKPREEWRKVDGKTIAKADLGALMRDTLLAHVPGSKHPGHSTHSAAFQRNHGRRPRRPDVQNLRRQL